TMGTPIVAGHDITWDDTYQKRHVAIVNEALARETWHSSSNALGKRVRVGTTDAWAEVVGVAADTRDDGVDKPVPTSIYWPTFLDHFQGNETDYVNRSVWFVIR